MTIKVFSAEYLDDLARQATISPRHRQHRNIHGSYADPCQRFFNAIEPGSYLRPHCHGDAQGAETMIAIRGLMALVVFDGEGNIEQIQRFGAGSHAANPDVASGTEISPGRWHTVVSLEPGSIVLEIKAGPFDPDAPKFPAPWAPPEDDPEKLYYMNGLVAAVLDC